MAIEQPPGSGGASAIEFPCLYPIQVIMARAQNQHDVQVEEVIAIVHEHAEPIDREQLSFNPSRKGNYVSVRIQIVATGEPQLKTLHQSLMALPFVKLVL